MNSLAFGKYLEDVFGSNGAAKVLEALERPPSVSVRLNPAKWRSGAEVGEIAGMKISERIPWCGSGYFLERRPVFTLDPVMHSGAYYVQDSSSMFVGFVFRQVLREMLRERAETAAGRIPEKEGYGGTVPRTEPVRVLDLCAAPGGKTTDIASGLREMLGDGFLLVSNEVMKNRAGTLADNVALWGDPNVVVTSADPAAFAGLAGFFDIILTDVPCSGEGMFRKDEAAAEQWSEETVELCAARQRRILADVWPALAPGGMLIYSTCTFNRMENDGNVGWIASELGAEPQNMDCPFDGPVRTAFGFSLAPGLVRGEGQYCAVLSKNGAGNAGKGSDGKGSAEKENAGMNQDEEKFRRENLRKRNFRNCGRGNDGHGKRENAAAFSAAVSSTELEGLFSTPVCFRERNGLTVAVPQRIGAELAAVESCLKPLTAGVAVGTVKGGRLVPSADLALTTVLRENAFPNAELDKKAALEFLHRDSIRLEDAPQGYVTVSYKGFRLGFVKNIGSRCNNLHPMSRRILMSIL